jgi:2-oxo-hept-3-ene-1,7-dioate hydratase
MLHNDAVENAARKLHEAERSAKQIRQLSLDYPETTIEDAYQIQRAWTALRIAEGCKLCGRKVGLTSKSMQLASKIDEPNYGALFDDMFIQDGTDIPMSRFILPRVEVELGFVLGKRLQGPNCTISTY